MHKRQGQPARSTKSDTVRERSTRQPASISGHLQRLWRPHRYRPRHGRTKLRPNVPAPDRQGKGRPSCGFGTFLTIPFFFEPHTHPSPAQDAGSFSGARNGAHMKAWMLTCRSSGIARSRVPARLPCRSRGSAPAPVPTGIRAASPSHSHGTGRAACCTSRSWPAALKFRDPSASLRVNGPDSAHRIGPGFETRPRLVATRARGAATKRRPCLSVARTPVRPLRL